MSSWQEFLELLIARIVCDLLERGIERTPEEVTDAFAFALLDVAAFADKAQRKEFSLRPLRQLRSDQRRIHRTARNTCERRRGVSVSSRWR
jgi:hypothetical protein